MSQEEARWDETDVSAQDSGDEMDVQDGEGGGTCDATATSAHTMSAPATSAHGFSATATSAPGMSATSAGPGEGGSTLGAGASQGPSGGGDGVDDAYIQLFLLKFVCPQESCFGTLAPLVGQDASVCNMCGKTRSTAEFLAEVEAYSSVTDM
jgi:hypothetical protein